jgi:glycosyltransferase involved in cell wall biosynthesis
VATPSGTVVVCTRDRKGLLEGCLEHLAHQTPAEGDEVEVVVVDNGSTDGTADLLAAWVEGGPRRRVVFEPEAGLSRARNAGLAAAAGEVVLFVDDDALAPRGWVAAHLAAHRRHPGTAAVGGPVVLTWPEGRPRWLTPGLEHWYSALDHGDEAGPFPPPHGPYGTNMSVRRDAVTAVGGFAEQLGRRGRSLRSGEEAELWQRLWAAGETIVYDPATLVLHRVAPGRSSRRWLLRRGWGQGRTNVVLATLASAGAPGAGVNGGGANGGAGVEAARADARFVPRLLADSARALRRWDEGAAIDALARATGHTAAALGHITHRTGRHGRAPGGQD